VANYEMHTHVWYAPIARESLKTCHAHAFDDHCSRALSDAAGLRSIALDRSLVGPPDYLRELSVRSDYRKSE
jgi:hypothetical protein